MASEIKDSGELPYPSEFKELLDKAKSGIGNNYEISIIAKKYNSWLQEHQEEMSKLSGEGGMNVGSSSEGMFGAGLKVGGKENDLDNLPSELKEVVKEKRRKKEAQKQKEQLGIPEIKEQLNKLSKVVTKLAKEGGNKGGGEGKDKKEQIFYDGLKLRAILARGSQPFFDRPHHLDPWTWSFSSSMSGVQRNPSK